MPEQPISQQQLDLMADILGGLYGEQIFTLLQQPPQQQAPVKSIRPSPYGRYLTKGSGSTTALTVKKPHGPKVKPVKGPVVPSPTVAASAQRPSRPIDATPLQPPTQAPNLEPPKEQHQLLQEVKLAAQKYDKPNIGTELAHWLRTHYANRAITSQFEAAGVNSLDDLTQILNKHRPPQEAVNLDVFHDDNSPFAIISQPRETLEQGGIPAVVVGPPYAGQVHVLEQAFPGVHFMAVDEAPKELEEAAAKLEKPLPNRVKSSPFGLKKVFTKATEPNPKPQKPPQEASGTNKPTNPLPQEPPTPPINTESTPPENVQPVNNPPVNTPTREVVPTQPAVDNNQTKKPYERAKPITQDDPLPLNFSLEIYNDAATYNTLEDFIAYIESDPLHAFEGFSNEELRQWAEDAWNRVNIGQDPYHEHDEGLTEVGMALKTAPIVKKERLKNSKANSNGSWKITLDNGTAGLYKPVNEEDPHLRYAVPGNTYYLRETVTSRVTYILGLLNLVPETIIREIDGVNGSVQRFIDNAKEADDYYIWKTNTYPDTIWNGEDKLILSAALDYLIANTDRHSGNWLIKDDTGELVLIDHGLAFPVSYTQADNWNMAILRRAINKNYVIPEAVREWQDKLPAIEKALTQAGIDQEALSLLRERLSYLVANAGKSFVDLVSSGDNDFHKALRSSAKRIGEP